MAAKSGPAAILAYFLASLFVVPSLLSKAELATAMPKSGGVYFYLARSFGALYGSFAGLAAWFSLSLKSAFALLGIGIVLEPLVSSFSPQAVKIVAVGCTVLFTVLNILSVKESGRLQLYMVVLLIGLLGYYIGFGLPRAGSGGRCRSWKTPWTEAGACSLPEPSSVPLAS